MRMVFWMSVAGVAGTLSRYYLSGSVAQFGQKHFAWAFPWGTFTVNMLGCFLFGLVWSLAEARMPISTQVRTVLLVGFMGAFTTFSTFAYESAAMVEDGEWYLLAMNCLGQNVVGIALMLLGMRLGRFA